MGLKKTIAAALAAAMLASAVAVPAFAAGSNTMQYYYENDGYKTRTNEEDAKAVGEDNTNLTTSGTTQVKYEVHSSYTWSIPSIIDFGSDAGVGKIVTVDAIDKNDTNSPAQGDTHGRAMKVKVTKNVIEHGKSLFIKLETSDDSVYDTVNRDEDNPNVGKGFFIANDEGQRLYFSIFRTYANDEKDSSGGKMGSWKDQIMEVYAGVNTESQGLIFELNTENKHTAEIAGTYVNTLTFTAEVRKSSM